MRNLKLINSRTVFSATLIVVATLVLLVYFTGLPSHRSLYTNAVLSTSILSVVFLLFITTGLHKGWKLKENAGSFSDKLRSFKRPPITSFNGDVLANDTYIESHENSLAGCFISLLLWFVIGVFGAFLLWAFGIVIWGTLLALTACLYWIVFRAYRLIFKNSASCKGRFFRSLGIGILFTLLYNCWFYAIIFAAHYFK